MTDLSQIDPVHIEQIQKIIDEKTQFAETDEEALRIVLELIEETRNGMTWDEEGNEVRIIGDEQWDDSQIEAQARVASASAEDMAKKKREAIIWGGIMLVAVLFAIAFFVSKLFGGGGDDVDQVLDETTGEIVEENLGAADNPKILEIADGLGGRVRLGQPRTIEILAPDGESYTLGVIVAPVKDDGILQISDALRDGELVAEWVYGTVVNYVIGVPERVIADIGSQSRIVIRTTTGATYHFVCVSMVERAPQETEIFKQSRPGVTLFPLPSSTPSVPTFWCPYDPTNEDVNFDGVATVSMGQYADAGNVSVKVDAFSVNDTVDGQVSATIRGFIKTKEGQGSVIVNLDTAAGVFSPVGDYFMASETEAEWMAEFLLPQSVKNELATLDIRSPIGGNVSIDLGVIPDPRDGLRVSIENQHTQWVENTQEIEVVVSVLNAGEYASVLTTDDFTATQNGGALQTRFNERMPVVVPGNMQNPTPVTVKILPMPGQGNVEFFALNTLWEIQGVP